jgi:hypothetical protein
VTIRRYRTQNVLRVVVNRRLHVLTPVDECYRDVSTVG